MTSGKLFELENLRAFTKNPFLIYRISEYGEQILSYKELLEVIEQLHRQFDDLKIISPSCFAMDLNVSFESIAFLIGILCFGCHFCPVPKDASNSFLNKCAAGYFLTSNVSTTEKFKSIKFLDDFSIVNEKFSLYVTDESKKHEKPRTLPTDMCYTISTTGTTGVPKMVHVPYNCIAPNISALCNKFQLTHKDVIYLGTPFTFDPFVVELFMALAVGAALLLTPSKNRLNTKNLLQILWPEDESRLAVTVIQMTPTNFRHFGLEDIKQKIFASTSKLRILILGGEEFPRRYELIRWLPENFETFVRVFNIYGITELSCWSSIYEWNHKVEQERSPIGLPLDETLLRMVNTVDGSDIGGCGEGELLVGSAKRKTYMPDIDNIESIKNNVDILYRSTGDLVERIGTDDIIYVGRINNIVKRSGKRICLTGIEQKLGKTLSNFGHVQTVFLWHEKKQILICCFKIDNEELIPAVKSMILKNLADHEKPDRIVIVKELPTDKHNKLDRKKLLQDVLKCPSPDEPVQKFQKFLTEILQFDNKSQSTTESTPKRLKLEKLESDDMSKSFTATGGSSFQALSLATEIGEDLNSSNDQRILLKMLLDTNTSICDICDFLKNVKIKENVVHKAKNAPRLTSNTTSKLKGRKLKMLWRVYMEKCIDAAPALSQNSCNIHIGSHAGLLLNIEASTGEVLSRFRLRDRIECQVADVSSELALVGCNSGYLYGLNFLEDQLKWTLYIGKQVKAKPLVVDGQFAIVGCYSDEFNLVGEKQIKWRKKIGTRPIFAAPIMLSSCSSLICTLDGTYECLDVRTSQTIWTQKCGSPIFSTPKSITNGNKFLIAEVEGKLHMCLSETGQILQSFQCDGNIFSNIQTFESEASILHIIFGCHDHHVYCLKCEAIESTNLKDDIRMVQKWKTTLNAAVFATPNAIEIYDENYVIACSTKGLLAVLENSTGCVVAEHKMDNEVFSSIFCVQSNKHEIKIYFGCRDNYFYCFQY